jgi:hypothetical protein
MEWDKGWELVREWLTTLNSTALKSDNYACLEDSATYYTVVDRYYQSFWSWKIGSSQTVLQFVDRLHTLNLEVPCWRAFEKEVAIH